MRTNKEVNIKGKKLCLYLLVATLVISLIMLSNGTSEVQAAGGLPYDDFHQDTIDRTKWQSWGFVRRIKNGVLESAMTRYGSDASNNTAFTNGDTITSFQADVTVTEFDNNNAELRARLWGYFYNAYYTEPGDGTGDVFVQVGIRDTGSGSNGYYKVDICENTDCSVGTLLAEGDPIDWTVTVNDTRTVSLEWDDTPGNEHFTFGFEGGSPVVVPVSGTVQGPPKSSNKVIGTRVHGTEGDPTKGGYIDATFNDVKVKADTTDPWSDYDDFEAVDGMIDPAKWQNWEFVRQVNNGVFESAVARWGRNGSNNSNFFDVSAITAFQADVTVKEVINDGASPRARLSGAFYNDGTPGDRYTGDILAGVQIYHNGTQLRGNCWVSRCILPDCNLPGESINIWNEYLTTDPIQLDETHTLSLVWDVEKNKFTFGFDDVTVTTDVTLPDVVTTPQGLPFNGIGTRVHGIDVPPFEGEGGYIKATFDNVVLLTDFQPPYTSGHDPAPGATNVAVDTNIVVHVRDDGTGVDQSTIVMRVDDVVVAPTISGDVADYTLTYDPPSNFGNEQPVEVSIEVFDLAGNVMEPYTYSFLTEPASGNPWEPVGDNDEDGIPNDVETDLGTNPNVKTLFVRPKQQLGFNDYVYWQGFIALFPDDSRFGFADIPAFTHAGIEISVIGDPGNPYGPMQQFGYDPATDANHPPCDILEIIYKYKPDNAYCAYGSHNSGHTYFYSLGSTSTWYWDTKGYVPNSPASPHYLEHGYFTPLIYPFPLDNYLNEGAYPQVAMDQLPIETPGCGLNQCYDTTNCSPLNLADSEAVPPYTESPDGTVEFNEIVFNADMQIIHVGSQGIRYDRDTVMRRTLAHEMGHALLAAAEADHCTDVRCIMYSSVADWVLRDFGPGNCAHKPGGAKDIRAPGVVHNSIH